MKKPIAILTMVSAMTVALSSCTNEEPLRENGGKIIKTINAETLAKTKVWVDETNGQFKWHSTGDKLAIIETCSDGLSAKFETEDSYTLDKDSRNAVFTVNLDARESDNYIYTAVYPSIGCGSADTPTDIVLTLPENQTPATDNYDTNADLMVSKAVVTTQQKTPVSFSFDRIAAIAKMTITGIPAGEKINEIKITAPNHYLSGTVHMNAIEGSIYVDNPDLQLGSKHSLNIQMQGCEATGNDVVWFTTLPADLSNGGKMTINVATDKGQYSKTLETEGKELKFVSGDLTKFTVALEASEPVKLETPVVHATAKGKTVTVKWDIIHGANTYNVTCGSLSHKDVVLTEAVFEMEYGQTYEVSVTAVPIADSDYLPSDPGKTSVTTEQEPVVDKRYGLLTDAADLRVGDELIIMANYASHYDSNFQFTFGTKYTSGPSAGQLYGVSQGFNGEEITEIATNTIVWTVEAGSKPGTFALKSSNNTGDKWDKTYGKYLSLSGSRIAIDGTSVNEQTSLTFAVTPGSKYAPGPCSISSVASPNSRIKASWSSEEDGWFSTNGTNDVYVYYAPLAPRVELQPLETPVVNAVAEGNKVNVSWNAIANAGSYTVTCGAATKTVTSTSEVFEMDWNQTYEVSVVAIPVDATQFAPSAAGKTTVTTEEQATSTEKTVTFSFPMEGWIDGEPVPNDEPFVKEAVSVAISGCSWREYGFFMPSSGYISIQAEPGKTITKIIFTAGGDKTLNLIDYWEEWSVKGDTVAEYNIPYEHSMEFSATSGSGIASIEVTYK